MASSGSPVSKLNVQRTGGGDPNPTKPGKPSGPSSALTPKIPGKDRSLAPKRTAKR
jgi:hypothetical protein